MLPGFWRANSGYVWKITSLASLFTNKAESGLTVAGLGLGVFYFGAFRFVFCLGFLLLFCVGLVFVGFVSLCVVVFVIVFVVYFFLSFFFFFSCD